MIEAGNNNPLISVVVPVYNVGPYVERCIRSIQKQTYTNWELIVVDDGSSDDSGNICEELGKEDSRIHVVHKENGGVSSARLKGLIESKGEYISFLDADDALRENALSCLNEYSRRYCADVVIGDFESNAGGDMTQLHSNKRLGLLNNTDYLESTVLLKLSMSTQARLYKRHVFESLNLNLDRRIVQNEDFLWNLIISQNIKTAFVVDKVVYSVYSRDGSASKVTKGFDYWQFFFSYIEDNLSAFNIKTNYYLLFKISRVADLMRNYYYIDFREKMFDNVREFGYHNHLSIWGFFVVFFSRHPKFCKLQKILKFHPSILLRH